MDPVLFKVFAEAFTSEWNRLEGTQAAARSARAEELRLVRDRIERLVDAITEGTPAAALRDRLESLEARRLALEAEAARAPAPAPRMHPALAEVYRQKVANIVAALESDAAAEARDLLRSLVDSITLHPEGSGQRVGVRGELAAVLGLASGGSGIQAGSSTDVLIEQIKLVAGARNRRCHYSTVPI
jgi:hypothetical protein